MNATRALPEHYRLDASLDLSRSLKMLLWLNLIGAVLFVLFGALFVWVIFLLRPTSAAAGILGGLETQHNLLVLILDVIGLTVIMMVLHEALHGVFFWIFTRARPVFGVGGGYAYAAAPGWYLPRRQYWIVGLAPLVGISAAGLLLAAVLPPGWFLALWALMTFNASGAVGDIAVCIWLLRKPAATLVEDRGDAVSFYVPGE